MFEVLGKPQVVNVADKIVCLPSLISLLRQRNIELGNGMPREGKVVAVHLSIVAPDLLVPVAVRYRKAAHFVMEFVRGLQAKF